MSVSSLIGCNSKNSQLLFIYSISEICNLNSVFVSYGGTYQQLQPLGGSGSSIGSSWLPIAGIIGPSNYVWLY